MRYTLWGRLCTALILCALFAACSGKHVERASYESEQRKHEVKVVAPVDIYTAALEKGQNVVAAAEKELIGNLHKALQDSGSAEGALRYCNIAAYPIIDSLARANKVEIKRVSFQTRNPQDTPDSLEAILLDSYHYSFENNIELHDAIQEAGEKYQLYTKPIIIKNSLCLQCHGTVGKDMTAEQAALIQSLYPQDSALNYELNDLRGMWSVKMATKDIVMGL